MYILKFTVYKPTCLKMTQKKGNIVVVKSLEIAEQIFIIFYTSIVWANAPYLPGNIDPSQSLYDVL